MLLFRERRYFFQIFFNPCERTIALFRCESRLDVMGQREGLMRPDFHAEMAAIAAAALAGHAHIPMRDQLILQDSEPPIHAHTLRARGGGIDGFFATGFSAFVIERVPQLGRDSGRGYSSRHFATDAKGFCARVMGTARALKAENQLPAMATLSTVRVGWRTHMTVIPVRFA